MPDLPEVSQDHTDDSKVDNGDLLNSDIDDTKVDDTKMDGDQVQFELPEEFRENPMFEGIDSVDALAKRLADGGAPESYQFAEGFDEDFAGAISEHAKNANMNQVQLDAMLEFKGAMEKAAENQMWAELDQGRKGLQEEWGKDYDDNIGLANKVIGIFDKAGDLRKLMKTNPVMSNHPTVVKLFKAIGDAIDIDRFVESEGNPTQQPTDEHGNTYFSSYDKSMPARE